MKNIFFCLLLIGFYNQGISQKEPVRCGTLEYIDYMDQNIPGFKESADQAFMKANKLSKANANQTLKTGESNAATGEWFDTTYCIPVVFHVLVNSANTDVPDSTLKSYLKSMNDDFNRRNSDTMSTPNDFKNIVSGANIEFVLATKDSAGNPASGIVRKSTDIIQFNLPPNTATMKLSATSGSLAWDPDRFLNFWVCNLIINGGGNGLLGFAQPPLNHSFWPSNTFTGLIRETDGVALDESVFYSAAYRRVLAHEVGHYLSLRHVWGDKLVCSDPGDYIDDTPDQSETSQGNPCGQARNTCTETPPKLNVEDMQINYMSYHTGSCQTAFSKGQTRQMRSVLKTDRTKLAYVCKVKGVWVSDINNTNPINPIMVTPNPVNDVTTIKINLETINPHSTINIYDNMGRVMYSKSSNESYYEEKVDCSMFERGVYFVEVLSKGFKNTTKFIKE